MTLLCALVDSYSLSLTMIVESEESGSTDFFTTLFVSVPRFFPPATLKPLPEAVVLAEYLF